MMGQFDQPFPLLTNCHYLFAETIDKPQLTDVELEQIEAVYAVEDRSWKKVIRDRTVCAMGKFKLSGNKEKVKAAARSTKENAQSSGVKRKAAESTSPRDTLTRHKRSTTPQCAFVESSKHTAPSSVIIGVSGEVRKGVVEATDEHCLSSPPVKLAPFFEEIKKLFDMSSITAVEGSPDVETKFQMSFDRVTTVRF